MPLKKYRQTRTEGELERALSESGKGEQTSGVKASALSVERIYADYFDFVWRNVRRRGVSEAAIDDVVQDVFVIVHRRLASFEGRSSIKTWLYGIVRRVVKDHFRAVHQRTHRGELDESLHKDSSAPDGPKALRRKEGASVLHQLLDSLSEKKREVFILAELEELSITEIAEALGENFNTVYSRVRSAREEFEAAVERYQTEEKRRSR